MLKPTLAALLAFSLPTLALACPEINGEFSRATGPNETTSVYLATKITNGKYSYNLDAESGSPFFEADGIEKKISHEGQTGSIKLTCSGNWLELEAKQDGGPAMKQKYILLSATQIQLESEEPSLNGVFTKK